MAYAISWLCAIWFWDVRSIHFRVSDTLYGRIAEEAENEGTSVSNFAREATMVRTVAYAYRRGMRWPDANSWEKLIQVMEAIERSDAKLRAKSARQRKRA